MSNSDLTSLHLLHTHPTHHEEARGPRQDYSIDIKKFIDLKKFTDLFAHGFAQMNQLIDSCNEPAHGQPIVLLTFYSQYSVSLYKCQADDHPAYNI
ncbi:hypothetical protein GC101_20095 [Paenibacillus sp. LMG 31459]|uniref:Uncharacterized protein n=1 Tax=Paenibacillus phytohabitans TaxID=2654978 RepID=A0ABX1YJY7_9BACL|nr:hypothetical protein [Paenibacillus phytohabitans]